MKHIRKFLITRTSDYNSATNNYNNIEIKKFETIDDLIHFRLEIGYNIIIKKNYWFQEWGYHKDNLDKIMKLYNVNWELAREIVRDIQYEIEIYDTFRENGNRKVGIKNG